MSHSPRLARLTERAELLRRLRAFFHDRGFLEVETPLLSDEVIPELHIEPLRLGDCPLFLPPRSEARNSQVTGTVPFFLQASPELHMKRLLAEGANAIFQVTHSFRAGERGRLHNPEFTIVEWYRVGDDMAAGITLVDELMQSLLGTPPAQRTTYAEAFQQHAGVQPFAVSDMDLAAVTRTIIGEEISIDPKSKTPSFIRDELLNLILAKCVEPQLGCDRPEIIYHYPASQAALAKTIRSAEGHEVAERFELYYLGIELANGYHELANAAEQRRRLEQVNAERVADGRPALPIPESLLAALGHGFPDCTGVALGFDRLAMLASGTATIDEVLTFPHRLA